MRLAWPVATARSPRRASLTSHFRIRQSEAHMETHQSGPDPAWNSLYRIGGICLFATGVIYFVATVLTMVVPAPTDAETYLRALATHRRLASTLFTGLALADLLFVPATLALYFALRHLARAAVLLAAAMSLFYAVVDLTVNEIGSLGIVT